MLLVIIQKYKFRCSKNICLIFKCSTAVLVADENPVLEIALHPEECVKYSFIAAIVILSFVIAETKSPTIRRRDPIFSVSYCSVGIMFLYLHCVFCDRTSLIYTKYINTGKCLNAFHIMKQYFCCASRIELTASATLAEGKALRNHSDHSRLPLT